MVRQIIHIDEEKCNGCGLCAEACHENAIAIINGKAKLIRDDYCDGMGDCLPNCPTGAITFENREAAAYDEAAVAANKKKKQMEDMKIPHACPGMAMRQMKRATAQKTSTAIAAPGDAPRPLPIGVAALRALASN